MGRILICCFVMLSVADAFSVVDASCEVVNGVAWYYRAQHMQNHVDSSNQSFPPVTTNACIVKGTVKYAGDLTIPSELSGLPVTSIGEWAFSACTGLTSVTISPTVKAIGEGAFCGCGKLSIIKIPEGVVSVGGCAFDGCTGLRSVAFPSSLTYVGEGAFAGCTGLVSSVILDGVKGIGSGAFFHCVGLTSVEIGSGITNIGSSAFEGCSGLKSVRIPSTLKNIHCEAFSKCPNLKRFDLVDGGQVVSVDFEGYKKILSRPGGKIKGDKLTNNRLLKRNSRQNVSTVTTNGLEWTYRDMGGFVVIGRGGGRLGGIHCGTNGLAVSQNIAGALVIPSVLGGKPVQCIGGGAFSGCKSLTSVTIPPCVTSVGEGAFYGCSNLTSVTIPAGVMNVGRSSFCGCEGLKTVVISEGVKSIGDYAFSRCYGLATVKIPASVTSIGRGAFDVLDSFEVDSGNAFYSSTNGMLCSKDGRTLIRGVNGNVTIPSCVTNIARGAFDCWLMECKGRLKSVTIPSSVKIIGGPARADEFWRNGQDSAFGCCSGLLSFVVDEANSTYSSRNGLLCTKDGRTLICGVNGDVIIPLGVTNIGRSAFHGYCGLKSVTIPSSVTRIEERAFAVCIRLASLTIPSTVTNIDCRAFMACPNLKTIDIVRNGDTERVPANDFFRRLGFTEQRQREADKADAQAAQSVQLQAIREELKRVRTKNRGRSQ